jgi:hypothetical protein
MKMQTTGNEKDKSSGGGGMIFSKSPWVTFTSGKSPHRIISVLEDLNSLLLSSKTIPSEEEYYWAKVKVVIS